MPEADSSRLSAALHQNRATLALAAPISAGHVGQMLMGLADTVMIGHVGMVPLAACSFANTLLMVPLVFGFGVLSSVSIRGAIGFGAGDGGASGRSLRGGLWLALALGLFVTLVAVALLPFLPVFGQKPEVNAAAGMYFFLCAASSTAIFFSAAAKNFCEALSRPWIPFWILLGSVFLNVLLNWIFIYGNLGFPAMGLNGAGLATLLARVAGAVVMVAYPMLSPRLGMWARGAMTGPWLRTELPALAKLGLPTGSMSLAEISGFAAGSLMMGWISIEALAAHQIAITCAATTFMIPLGISQALSVRVGNARGGRRWKELVPIVEGGLGLSILVMTACAGIFLFGRHAIAGLFTSEPALISLAAKLLLIAGIFQIFDGLQIAGSGILRGFEDVRFPMLIGIAAYWMVALPFSYTFAFVLGFQAIGVWMGFCTGLACAAAALLLRVRWRMRGG
jgi:multidrug resistance protein, MATE family